MTRPRRRKIEVTVCAPRAPQRHVVSRVKAADRARLRVSF
jgi:hypothetical protein